MHPQDLREESSNTWWQTIWEYWCQGEMADQRLFQPTMEPLKSSYDMSETQHRI